MKVKETKTKKQKLVEDANYWHKTIIPQLEESLGIFESRLDEIPHAELIECLQCIDGLLSAAERTMEDMLTKHKIGPMLSKPSPVRLIITSDQLGFLIANAISWRFRDHESLDARKTDRIVGTFCHEMQDATTLPADVLKEVARIAKEYSSTIPLP